MEAPDRLLSRLDYVVVCCAERSWQRRDKATHENTMSPDLAVKFNISGRKALILPGHFNWNNNLNLDGLGGECTSSFRPRTFVTYNANTDLLFFSCPDIRPTSIRLDSLNETDSGRDAVDNDNTAKRDVRIHKEKVGGSEESELKRRGSLVGLGLHRSTSSDLAVSGTFFHFRRRRIAIDVVQHAVQLSDGIPVGADGDVPSCLTRWLFAQTHRSEALAHSLVLSNAATTRGKRLNGWDICETNDRSKGEYFFCIRPLSD